MNDDEILTLARAIRQQLQGDESDRLRLQLAEEFGRRRGWTLAYAGVPIGPDDVFTAAELAGLPENDFAGNIDLIAVTDHANHYRLDGQPTAIVAHLYGWNHRKPAVEAFCRKAGLIYETPTDFPSWHYPGESTLVVYRKA